MKPHRRHRWIAWFALLGLLFQQAAMAAYVCPYGVGADLAVVQAALSAERAPCEQMAMSDAARCEQHCNPQQVAHPPLPVTEVPPAVPASLPTLASVVVLQDRPTDLTRHAPEACATAPPLTVRDCSFQF